MIFDCHHCQTGFIFHSPFFFTVVKFSVPLLQNQVWVQNSCVYASKRPEVLSWKQSLLPKTSSGLCRSANYCDTQCLVYGFVPADWMGPFGSCVIWLYVQHNETAMCQMWQGAEPFGIHTRICGPCLLLQVSLVQNPAASLARFSAFCLLLHKCRNSFCRISKKGGLSSRTQIPSSISV